MRDYEHKLTTLILHKALGLPVQHMSELTPQLTPNRLICIQRVKRKRPEKKEEKSQESPSKRTKIEDGLGKNGLQLWREDVFRRPWDTPAEKIPFYHVVHASGQTCWATQHTWPYRLNIANYKMQLETCRDELAPYWSMEPQLPCFSKR